MRSVALREKWGRKTLNETEGMCIERGMWKEDTQIKRMGEVLHRERSGEER